MAENTTVEHTPGPWEVIERSGYFEIIAACADSDWYGRPHTHAVAYADTEMDEQLANAHLIAAAPDLLALLTRWANWLDRADEPDDDCGYLNDDGWDDARALAKLTRAALLKASPRVGGEG